MARLNLVARAVFAAALVAVAAAQEDEPYVDEPLEDLESTDKAVPPGEEGGGSHQPQGGAGDGERELTHEELLQRQKQQQDLVEFLMRSLSSECQEELRVVLQTPQEQQSNEQFSDVCRSEVQSKIAEFQGNGGGSSGSEGEGGEQQQQRQQQQQQQQPGRTRLPRVVRNKSKRPSESDGQGIGDWLVNLGNSEWTTAASVLVAVFVPFLGAIAILYWVHWEKESRMSPEMRAARDEEREREAAALKKREAKAKRQGKRLEDVE